MRADAPSIMLAAGEASGDLHGAALCHALRAQAPGCRLFGMGGPRMAAAGMDLLVDVTAVAAAGGTEAVSLVPLLYRAYRRLRAVLDGARRPGVLVVIDFPEFNLRLARAARRAGVPVEFVGHPLLDALAGAPDRAAARRQLGLDDGTLVIGLLPGSRREEVERVLPAMREAVAAVGAARPDARCVLALAPTIEPAAVERRLGAGRTVAIARDRAHAVMRAADLLLVASGTATLEAALLGTPMVVCYRVSRLTELMVRSLMRVPWISLPNLTLGRAVVPELTQEAATGERLGREALRLLDTPGALDTQRAAFSELQGQLGAPGVGARAARLVLSEAGVVS